MAQKEFLIRGETHRHRLIQSELRNMIGFFT
jgi:hypothetical protein